MMNRRSVLPSLLAALVVGLAALGEATKPVVPAGLVPTPEKPGIALSLKTGKSSYAPGDTLTFTFTLPRPAYVYVYNLRSDGRIQLLVPNRFLQETLFPAGTHTLPTRGWVLRVTEPEGIEYLQLVASEVPLTFYEAKAFEASAFLLFTQPAAFAKTLQEMLKGSWGAVWTAFRVHRPRAALTVTTSPPGASVTAAGRHLGSSPVAAVIAPGRVTVQASLTGYETRSVTLNVSDGEEVNLSLTLSPARSAPWTRPRPTPPSPSPSPRAVDVSAGVGLAAGLDSIALELWVEGLGFGASARLAPPRPDVNLPGPGGEYPWGPEVEGYLALWLPVGRVGPILLGGLSFQDMAWIPAWYPPTSLLPQVVVEPEVWTQTRFTWGIGLGVGGQGWRVHLLWHARRGPVLGFVFGT